MARGSAFSSGTRPVKRCTAYAVTGCDGPWRFLIIHQLPGMGHLLLRQLPLTPEFNAAVFCGLDAGTSSLADKAPLQLRQYANHLPQCADCRRVGIDRLRKRTELDAAMLEIIVSSS